MHALLIADRSRLRMEHDAIRHLAIALASRIDLTCVVPETGPEREPDATFHHTDVNTIEVPMAVMPWLRRTRRDMVVSALERALPDVIYAFGERAWQLATDLAPSVDASVALELWCERQTRNAPRGRAAAAVAAYLAPTEPIASALTRRVDPGLVRVIPMGVIVPPQPKTILDHSDDSIALSVIGGARDVPAYQALLGGLSRTLTDFPQAQVFIELHGPNEHEIWREVKRLDMLDRVSAISDLLEHRALLLGSDVLLCPERFGEVRSIVYDALAHGLPIISSDDPYLDLADTAPATTVVTRTDTEGWAQGLRRVLKDPPAARDAGRKGREWVLRHHRLEAHVERLVDTFERMLTGGAVRLERPEPS